MYGCRSFCSLDMCLMGDHSAMILCEDDHGEGESVRYVVERGAATAQTFTLTSSEPIMIYVVPAPMHLHITIYLYLTSYEANSIYLTL
jgi:hypothetical protein